MRGKLDAQVSSLFELVLSWPLLCFLPGLGPAESTLSYSEGSVVTLFLFIKITPVVSTWDAKKLKVI